VPQTEYLYNFILSVRIVKPVTNPC